MSCFNVLLIVVLIILHLYSCYSGINTSEVTRLESGGECDGFRVPAAISPGCSAMVIKPHRAWILTLRFHPPG